jgi:hypothetical protein
MSRRPALRTQIIPSALDEKEGTELYASLLQTIAWEDGIKSKKGFTRLAKSIDLSEYPQIEQFVLRTLTEKCKTGCQGYDIYGVYLNYYRNGEMWTPNHSHPGTHQLVISLGATRTLTVGKKNVPMKNGDAILFGSAIHGIPKEPSVSEGRISIATFMRPVYE